VSLSPERRTFVLMLALALCEVSCDDTIHLTFDIVTPAGEDTFAGATRLRVANSTPPASQEVALGSDALTVELSKLEVSASATTVTVEALDYGGTVLARGASPPFYPSLSYDHVRIYLARVGAFGEAPPAAGAGPLGRVGVTVASTGGTNALIIGGAGPDGAAVAEAWGYDELLHELTRMSNASEARTDAAAIGLSSGEVAVCGGLGASGLCATCEIFDPSQTLTGTWSTCGGGDTETLGRAGAPAAVLGSGVLVPGGRDADGAALATAVLLTVDQEPTATVLGSLMVAPRAGHSVTAYSEASYALLYGGALDSHPVAELYNDSARTFVALDLDPSLTRSQHAAVLLDDGRVLVIGGRDAQGAYRGDAILVGIEGSATLNEGTLARPRGDHTVTRIGERLLVAGGRDATGVLDDAEILDISTLTVSSAASMRAPRADHAAVLLGAGTVLIVGGVDGAGALVGLLEIYTPVP
jgi:large repetitive protein